MESVLSSCLVSQISPLSDFLLGDRRERRSLWRGEDKAVAFVMFVKGHGQALVTARLLGSWTGRIVLRLWHLLV